MRWLIAYASLLIFAAMCTAQTPRASLGFLPTIELQDGGSFVGKEQPKQPIKDKDKDKDKNIPEKKEPISDVFSQLSQPRAEAPRSYTPNMLGDFPGLFSLRTIAIVGTQTTTTTVTTPIIIPDEIPIQTTETTTTTTTSTVVEYRTLLIHAASRGDFKIAENTSPMPVDRFFFGYNCWRGIRGPNANDRNPITRSQSTTQTGVGLDPTIQQQTNVFFPGAPILELQRETFGIEKTFLDGRASVELRVPVLQQSGNLPGFSSQFVGDLRITGKYALFLDREVGDVFSIGLAVSAPTGPAIETIEGPIHSTLLQPWVGYIQNRGRFYVLGFHSIVVPTDERDVTLLFNDLALGFWLYRANSERFLRGVVPTVEAHVTTPLNHRGLTEPIVVPDVVVLTTGVHINIASSSTFTLGIATPVSGPRIFDTEVFAQFNWRW